MQSQQGQKRSFAAKGKDLVFTVLGVLLFVAVWWIAAAAYGKELVFPTPVAALHALWDTLKSIYFWRAFAGSLWRSLVAFVGACVLAIVCAYVAKACKPLRQILTPIIGIIRSLPTMSVILLFVLLLSSQWTPLFVSGLVIFPVLYSGIDAALSAIPPELEETARLYGGGAWYKFSKVYLPLSAPAFLRVAGGAASLTLKLTVAAEVLAQTRQSLGLMMQQTRIYFEIGQLMALTIVVVIAALVLEWIISLIRRAVEY